MGRLRRRRDDGGVNPATGETIAEVPASTAEDANRAVEAAKAALPEWLDSTPRERGELLLKLADVMEENAEELAPLESKNVGKPLAAARDETPRWWTTSASSPAPRATSRGVQPASTCEGTRR